MNRFQWSYPTEDLKFPRSLNEAFGPHTSQTIEFDSGKKITPERLVAYACAGCFLCLVIFSIIGWI